MTSIKPFWNAQLLMLMLGVWQFFFFFYLVNFLFEEKSKNACMLYWACFTELYHFKMRSILSGILTDYFSIFSRWLMTGLEWLDKAFHIEKLFEEDVISKK